MKRLTRENQIGKGDIHASLKEGIGNCTQHCHDFFEIEYFIDGSGEHIMDGVKSDISPGMLYFMTPISFHGFDTDSSSLYNVMFSERPCDPAFLARMINSEGGVALKLEGEDKSFVEALFRELCCSSDEGYSASILNTVLAKLSRLKGSDTASSPISKGLLYIIENFRDSPTLDDTASYAGFTPTYFSALFKKEMGISFKEYLDRIRFGYAKKLIESSDRSIAQICSDSGFRDYPNFIRRFTKRYGSSPGKMKINQ